MPRWPSPTMKKRERVRERVEARVRAEAEGHGGTFQPGDKAVVELAELVSVVQVAKPDLSTSRVYESAHAIRERHALTVDGLRVTMASSGDYAVKDVLPAEAKAARAAKPWAEYGKRARGIPKKRPRNGPT